MPLSAKSKCFVYFNFTMLLHLEFGLHKSKMLNEMSAFDKIQIFPNLKPCQPRDKMNLSRHKVANNGMCSTMPDVVICLQEFMLQTLQNTHNGRSTDGHQAVNIMSFMFQMSSHCVEIDYTLTCCCVCTHSVIRKIIMLVNMASLTSLCRSNDLLMGAY